MSEIPVHPRPRRLVDWINPTGAKKVHSLVDKVYKQKNLEMAWERVQANRGSGGVDGQSLEEFAARSLGKQLAKVGQLLFLLDDYLIKQDVVELSQILSSHVESFVATRPRHSSRSYN